MERTSARCEPSTGFEVFRGRYPQVDGVQKRFDVLVLGHSPVPNAQSSEEAGRAGAPHQKLEDLIRQKLIERKRVLDYSMFVDPQPSEADIEDLLPIGIYVAAFNQAYAKELKGTVLTEAELGAQPRVIEKINFWLKAKGITLLKDGGFNHYRPAQAVLPMLTADSLKPDELARFERLFDRVAAAL